MRKKPIDRVIGWAGGPSALAHKLKVSPQLVYHWRTTGRIPWNRVLEMEALTSIPRHELRPDVYPPPEPVKEPVEPTVISL